MRTASADAWIVMLLLAALVAMVPVGAAEAFSVRGQAVFLGENPAWTARLAMLGDIRQDAEGLDTTGVRPVEAPGPVRRDSDGDGHPDRMGETVRVGGRVSAEAGVVDMDVFVMQSDGRGITVTTQGGPTVARGDSVIATGVIEQQNGRTQVRASRYSILPVPPRVPVPVTIDVSQALGERYESMVAEVTARIGTRDSNRGGHYVTLEAPGGDDVLTVFVPNARLGEISLADLEVGDRIHATGVIQQHDFTSPYTSYYELIPRTAGDLEQATFPRRYYRNALLIGGLLILIAVGAVVLLRVQVRRRTRQLAASRARLRRLAEATFEGIVIHAEGEIVDVNQAVTEMIGYSREELIGERVFDFVSESTRSLVSTRVSEDSEEPYECVLIRRDGSTFPADIQAKVVTENGRKLRIVAVRDATQRKKDEAELLLAKQEAEQVARLKSSLLNNMSHELRTPITSIIGYAELIIEEPSETHALFAERIRQSGRRLSDTLRSVLDMAQIEAGTMDLHVAEVDTGTLVSEVVAAHEPMAGETGVHLFLNVDDAPVIPTDRILCYRVLTNLVHNALKFTNEGHVRVTVDDAEPGVRLVVEDTGIGIAPNFLPDLFEPFKQESDGRTRTHDGTGLGLAITKRMVDLLGGHISVDSEKNQGSRFVVDLPPSLRYDDTPSVLRSQAPPQ